LERGFTRINAHVARLHGLSPEAIKLVKMNAGK
jgi:hypothetical protein